MTDIVERLNNLIECEIDPAQNELYRTARDEIAQLRQDNAEMRELLNTLAEGRALEPKP